MPADLHVHSLPMAEVQGLRAGSARNEGHQPPNTLGNRTPPHLKITTHTPKIIHTHSTQYETLQNGTRSQCSTPIKESQHGGYKTDTTEAQIRAMGVTLPCTNEGDPAQVTRRRTHSNKGKGQALGAEPRATLTQTQGAGLAVTLDRKD